MPQRTLVYELNEVPWRILDDFVDAKPASNFGKILSEGKSFTTDTPDRGHLSPWITWPTMHRGVENTRHGLQFIGQEIDNSNYPPVWEQVLASGHGVGVFGALQSWPPPRAPSGFFVPDMFAKDAAAHPASLSAFQSLNLDMTRKNGRVVERSAGIGRVAAALPRLIPQGIRALTLMNAGSQVLRERMERRYAYRRPVYQSVLGFDLFIRQLRRHRPAYSSFFTNHVAGLMHRYWRAAYPGDYDAGAEDDESFYADAIQWGMEVADRQLGALMRQASQQGSILAVASSMGQAAIQPKDDPTSLKLHDPQALFSQVGVQGSWKRLHAMEPQVPVETESRRAANDLARRVLAVMDDDGEPVFRCDVDGKTVSVTISPSRSVIENESVMVNGQRRSLEEAGIIVIHPETPGTAYHIPQGHLVFWGAGINTDASRETVSSLEYAPTILRLMGVPRASYHLDGLNIVSQ